MRFLNPKTDLAFKKIFGSVSSREILLSFLNAILALSGEDVIVNVTIIDPYLAPKIEGMKGSFLDVSVKDLRGRFYIVEMQVLNVEGFEKRVLYNACKAYVNQLGKGESYHILAEVVAVTITDFVMFPDLERVVSRFRLRADENPLICHRDLELVFAELPKFTVTEAELATTLDRWFYFLRAARDLTAIPQSLAVEPAIVQALELANRATWTQEELDAQEKREFWIYDQRTMVERMARKARADALAQGLAQGKALGIALGKAEGMAQGKAEGKVEGIAQGKAEGIAQGKAEGIAQGIAEGIAQGIAEGIAQGIAEGIAQGVAEGQRVGRANLLVRLLHRRFPALPAVIEERVRAASIDQIDDWSERVLDSRVWEDVFL